MLEAMATLAVLLIGGICLSLIAVTGLLFISLIKLIFFPVTIAFDLVKWVVLLVVAPVIVFIVIPIVLLVVVPLMLMVAVPLVVALIAVAGPFLFLGLIGFGIAHAV